MMFSPATIDQPGLKIARALHGDWLGGRVHPDQWDGFLVIGAAEVLSIQYIDPLLSDVIPFIVLIAFLIVRPWGLFGTREELDRV